MSKTTEHVTDYCERAKLLKRRKSLCTKLVKGLHFISEELAEKACDEIYEINCKLRGHK